MIINIYLYNKIMFYIMNPLVFINLTASLNKLKLNTLSKYNTSNTLVLKLNEIDIKSSGAS